MRFDKLAGILERNDAALARSLNEARLFVMDPIERSSNPTDSRPDSEIPLEVEMRLPFPVVALEREDACVVLREQSLDPPVFEFVALTRGSARTDYVALGALEVGDSIQTVNTITQVCEPSSLQIFKVDRKFRVDPLPFDWGLFLELWRDRGANDSWESRLLKLQSAIERGEEGAREQFREMIGTSKERINAMMAGIFNAGLQIAVLDLASVLEPANFIVESREDRIDDPPQRIVTRAHWRPHYIALKPFEIRKRLLLPDPEVPVGTRAPHERRGHYRTLRSERFKAARGKRIWVKPHWVGPREATVGKNKYLVLLD